MEPTLVRNLVDDRGNNLVHAACAAGHANLLPFLARTLAHELRGAVNSDENKRGLTPTAVAIKVN